MSFVSGIPLSGKTESGGQPNTYYEYAVSTSQRTATSVRLIVKLRVHMRYAGSFFSFWIGSRVTCGSIVQTVTFKKNLTMWKGTAWKGWYTVFDKVVPLGTDTANLSFVPEIIRPWAGTYDALEKTNWQGLYGVGYWASRRLTEDGAFMNNRNKKAMVWKAGAYNRPKAVTNLTATPNKIEIIQANTQRVTVKWAKSSGATRYDVYIYKGAVPANAKDGDKVGSYAKLVGSTTGTSMTVNPAAFYSIATGDNLYFGVRAHDGQAPSKTVPWSKAVNYFENASYAPSSLWFIGRRGERNQIMCSGETARFYYSGLSNGSYPVTRFELVGSKDGLVKSWKQSDAKSENSTTWSVDVTLPRNRAKATQVFTLRAYDSKGRLLYTKSTGILPTVTITYYGGVIWRMDGYWREGFAYPLVNGEWRESQAVYMRVKSVWRTL